MAPPIPRPCALLAATLTLMAGGCRQAREPGTVRIDPALAALIPADTVMLIGVRIAALRDTPVFREYSNRPQAQILDQAAQQAGFDWRTDANEMLFASNGNHTLFTARGRFQVSQLSAKLESLGLLPQTRHGKTILTSGDSSVVFFNESTAAVGPTAVVESSLDRRNRPAGVPAPLQALVAQIPADSHAWATGVGGIAPLAIPETGNLANLGKVFGSLADWRIAMNFTKGVAMISEGRGPTEADAKKLHGALRFLVASGRLSTPDNQPDMLRFYDTIKVTQEGLGVRFDADVPMDLLQKAIASLPGSPRPGSSSPLPR